MERRNCQFSLTELERDDGVIQITPTSMAAWTHRLGFCGLILYSKGIQLSVIGEGMSHDSKALAQTYLDSFENFRS